MLLPLLLMLLIAVVCYVCVSDYIYIYISTTDVYLTTYAVGLHHAELVVQLGRLQLELECKLPCDRIGAYWQECAEACSDK